MKGLKGTDPVAVGPYRLLAEIGRGGMGRVLLGAAPDGRLVAVKQVHARIAADASFRARFRREVDASRRVSGAFTASVTDSDTEAETPWLASVFVTGPSLGDVVDLVGPLPGEAVRRIAAGLATALVEIHRAGLVHRDLKPDNVLLSEDGVRVIDFGIARAGADAGEVAGPGSTELTAAGVVVGSPAFMSPEQAEAKELTAASDVFALGSVLAMAASGRSPFARESTLRTLYDLVHGEPELAAVPEGLREVVAACLAKDPAARPTPAGLLELLGPVAPGGGDRWPEAVRGMIAAQQAEVDRVLGAPERTLVDASAAGAGPGGAGSGTSAGSGPWSAATASAAAPAGAPTAVRTTADGAAAPDGGGRVRRRFLRGPVVAGAVVVAAATTYALWPGGTGAEARGPEGDRFVNMVFCDEVARGLPLPVADWDTAHDTRSDAGNNAYASCTWNAYGTSREHAYVSWWMHRGTASATRPDGTTVRTGGEEAARADLAGSVSKRGAKAGPGPGDEAYWDTAWSDGTGCRLDLRDGNLTVLVRLSGPEHPAGSCREEAEKVATAVIGAMPR
ncbi:serine/threonine-protein kinase [Streptomyces sp. NPDC089799]|uniref:serine/threonine-protein kinase n=1 Tax=Streptomyces sp. NPDC089799 TaxID=3155066 RepID=UPI0034207379